MKNVLLQWDNANWIHPPRGEKIFYAQGGNKKLIPPVRITIKTFLTPMIRRAHIDDLPDILEIYNHYVYTSVMAFDVKPRNDDEGCRWFAKHTGEHPIIVSEHDRNICGWASLSPWAPHGAYLHTVELSLFVHPEYQRRGFGNALFAEIIARAGKLGYHCVISRITDGNDLSRSMHEKAGFTYTGIMREVGWKFERWLDVHVYQLILDTRKAGRDYKERK